MPTSLQPILHEYFHHGDTNEVAVSLFLVFTLTIETPIILVYDCTCIRSTLVIKTISEKSAVELCGT